MPIIPRQKIMTPPKSQIDNMIDAQPGAIKPKKIRRKSKKEVPINDINVINNPRLKIKTNGLLDNEVIKLIARFNFFSKL